MLSSSLLLISEIFRRTVKERHTPESEILSIFTRAMETTQKKHTQTAIMDSELSEQIKAVTKDVHVRAENTELMRSYQKGQVSLQQYQLLLCSLYKIYEALEEALDTNASHDAVAPIYFPQELARLESIEKDLEYFYGPSWREKMTVPAATLRYAQRLREEECVSSSDLEECVSAMGVNGCRQNESPNS
nr:hemeoxygenase 1 [Osteobrama belangeri]